MTILSLAIDAGGTIGIRLFFPIGLLLILLLRRKIIAVPYGLLLFYLMVAYPTCLFFIGLMRNADLEVAVSQYRSTVFSWAMFIALSGISYISLARALYSTLVVTAFVAIALAFCLILNVPGIESFGALGYFGLREVGDSVVPNVQFMSTLFFVPAALYFLLNKKLVPYCICFIGLIVGISKAGMIFLLVSSFFVFLWNKGHLRWFGLVFAVLVVFFLYNSPLWEMFIEIYRGESETVQVRLLHYESVMKLFSDDPIGFVFGFGMGTSFYSTGEGFLVTNIEVDHLNTIRKYGLIWSLVFFGFVVSISLRAILSRFSDVRTLGVCLASAFIVAGTNPVLITPIFFLILFITIQALEQSRKGTDSVRKSSVLRGAPARAGLIA
jgi:hypothetical protein